MSLCPQCPAFYPRRDMRLVDADGQAMVSPSRWLPTEEVTALLPPGAQRSVRNRRIRDARALRERGAGWRCPQGHALPDDYVETPMKVIGLIGAPYSMKTTYLGQLIAQTVEQAALAGLGLHFTLADAASRDSYAVKMASQLEHRRAPFRTQSPGGHGQVTAPIILRMTGLDSGPVNLCFFDVAGEGTLNDMSLAQDNPFLHVMDAAMLFITPRALTLPLGFRPAGLEATGTRQTLTAVDNTALALTDHPAFRGPRPPRDLPVAVLMAKSDELEQAPGVQVRFESLPLDGQFLADPDACLDEVGEEPFRVLSQFGGVALVTRVVQFTRVRSFHAVSAMGCAPGENEVFEKVAPFNVVDPLLATLYHLGMIGDRDGE